MPLYPEQAEPHRRKHGTQLDSFLQVLLIAAGYPLVWYLLQQLFTSESVNNYLLIIQIL